MVKPRLDEGRWDPKRQLPTRRIYNPTTKTYYLWRQRNKGTGESIQGKYVPEKTRT